MAPESFPTPPDPVQWAGPSRRARSVAVALAVVLALITFVVVNGVWRHAAPPPPKAPTSVEVKLVPAPPASAALNH